MTAAEQEEARQARHAARVKALSPTLTMCSDAHCILRALFPDRPRGGMHTNGGCRHLKDGPTSRQVAPLVGALAAALDEIDRLRKIADAAEDVAGVCVAPERCWSRNLCAACTLAAVISAAGAGEGSEP